MKRGIAAMGSLVVGAMIAIGCGGPPKATDPSAPGEATSAGASTAGAGASTTPPAAGDGSDAGAGAGGTTASTATADAGPAAPPEKPFAHNAEEATSFIDDAITSRSNDLVQCVSDDRARKKKPHAKIVVEVGIDEEGHLLGVKLPKGVKPDGPLVDCVLAALRGAPFPRSHAGVITVRRTFEDQAVYR